MTVRPWMRLAGSLLAVAGVALVARDLIRDPGALGRWLSDPSLLPRLAGAGLLQLAANLAVAGGFSALLAGSGERLPLGIVIRLYGRSQILKYLPGNVAHFAGRHALGRTMGVRHAVLARAAFLEAVLLVGVAGGFAVAMAPGAAGLPGRGAMLGLGGGCLLTGLVAAGVRRSPWRWSPAALPFLLRGVICHGAVFLLAGTAFWLAVGGVRASLPLRTAVAVTAVAWVTGFVVPGAAAGLGMREAVIILAIGPQLGEGAAALAALTYRVASVLADSLFFAGACLCPEPEPPADGGSTKAVAEGEVAD